MAALESGGVIYIGGADGALSGMIRMFADGEGQPLDPGASSPDELTGQVIDEIGFADADRPTPSELKVEGCEGRRFQARYQEGDGEVFSEICVLCGERAAYLIELEGGSDAQAATTAAMDALSSGDDFALVHVEAPDEMSHDGSLENKLEAIRRVDARVVAPLLDKLPALGDFRLILMPDHYTLLSTRTHDGTPVPFALYDSRVTNEPAPFTEAACENAPLLESGDELMRLLFEK
jgi:hypothetical protein